MKKIVTSLSLGLAAVLMSGCGGGGGSSTPSTGTGYYIDSAVEGVAYKCGTQEGNTTSKGAFTFDVGSGCEFYLGNMKLKTVDKSKLKDGIKIQETDINKIRVLLSLDSDGDPSNGISIDMDLVKKALSDKNFTSFPVGNTMYEELLNALSNAGATDVSASNATKHLFGSLLAGKTFYTKEIGSITSVATYSFDKNLTTLTVKDSKGERNLHIDINDKGELTIPIYSENNHASLVISDISDEYIELKNVYNDGKFKLFTDKSKADKEYVKTALTLTPDMLNGKTVYYSYTEKGAKFYGKATFTTDSISGVEIKKSDGSKENFSGSYRIENNILYFEGDDSGVILINKNPNSWTIMWNGDGTQETWYFSKPAGFPADL